MNLPTNWPTGADGDVFRIIVFAWLWLIFMPIFTGIALWASNKRRSFDMHYRRQESRHPTGSAIARLSADLDLAELCQDWEIVAADSGRVLEFLGYYDTQQLNDDERFTLMSLIIASYDEALSGAEDRGLQDQIIARLNARFDVLNSLVQYWAQPDEDDADFAFNFTPIARQIMRFNYGDKLNWPRTPFSIKRAQTLLAEQCVYDCVEIVDNRDGSFELFSSKISGRDVGTQEFSSIAAASEFAYRHFRVDYDAWQSLISV